MNQRSDNILCRYFVGIALCILISDANAIALQTNATGGNQLGFVDQDFADGFLGDFAAEAIHNSTVIGHADQGYAKASLDGSGVELASRSFAPDLYARSWAQISDFFTLETITGTQQQVLDAALNFNLTGSIEISPLADSMGSITLTMYGGSANDLVLGNGKVVSYIVSWDSILNQAVGVNDTSWEDDLYPVNPSVNGLLYNFNVALNWQLRGLKSDELSRITISLYSEASHATVDFSNTLLTDPDNPFVITSAPAGSTYRLVTGNDYDTYGVGLFAELDGNIVAPVPVPAALPLLLSGLIGVTFMSAANRDTDQSDGH